MNSAGGFELRVCLSNNPFALFDLNAIKRDVPLHSFTKENEKEDFPLDHLFDKMSKKTHDSLLLHMYLIISVVPYGFLLKHGYYDSEHFNYM